MARGYERIRAGRWCETRRSLVLAYLAGVAGPHRAAEARLHLSSCPACAQMAAQLREASERIAALLPLPDAATHHGPLTGAAAALAGLRHHLAELAVGAKQHAAAAAGRVDPGAPQYAAAARPGAVATVVAGCTALGGGATYCACMGFAARPRRRSATGLQRTPTTNLGHGRRPATRGRCRQRSPSRSGNRRASRAHRTSSP